MAITTDITTELNNILKDVPFVSNAKRDACVRNIQFYYFKAVNKPTASPKDKEKLLSQFLEQTNTLIKKLVQDKVILKQWGDVVNTRIVELFNPNGKSVNDTVPESTPESKPNPEPKVQPKPDSKPKVEPKKNQDAQKRQEDVKLSGMQHVDLSKIEEIKPRPGETPEQFQAKMNDVVNTLFSDPNTFTQQTIVNDEKEAIDDTEKVHRDAVSRETVETETTSDNETAEDNAGESTENLQSEEPKPVESDAEEVPVDQETFREQEADKSQSDETEEVNTENCDNAENQEPIIDHIDESSGEAGTQQSKPKTKNSAGKTTLILVSVAAAATAVGATVGYFAGKNYGNSKKQSSPTGMDAFKRLK